MLASLAYTPFASAQRGRELAAYAASLRKRCTITPKAAGCAGKADLPDFEPISKSLALAPAECDEAARKYRIVLGDCLSTADCKADEPGSPAVAFDNACLASPLPWVSDNGTRRVDEAPGLFLKGGENAGVGGALNATVLIHFSEGDKSAESLRRPAAPGNRIITARHCFTTRCDPALKEGRAHVRVLGRPERTYALDTVHRGTCAGAIAPARRTGSCWGSRGRLPRFRAQCRVSG